MDNDTRNALRSQIVDMTKRFFQVDELALVYDANFNSTKADRLRQCGTSLSFYVYGNGVVRLGHANFCKVRLCPMCAWRRSLKIFGQVSAVMDKLAERNYAYVFATFTVLNESADGLVELLDKMSKGFNDMTRTVAFKRAVKGYFRALEVTYNARTNTYHPHFHCIFAVNQSYFTGREYISHANWKAMWQEAARLPYDPNVDVRRVKNDTAKAVAEVAKYTVKAGELLDELDEGQRLVVFQTLDSALHGRRLVGFGGAFKQAKRELGLDDAIDGDLSDTHVRGDVLRMIVRYHWGVGGYLEHWRTQVDPVTGEVLDS